MQSAFLWGYMITPILGGALADKYGGETLSLASSCCLVRRVQQLSQRAKPVTRLAGKIVMAWGIAWFSLSSMLLPAAFSAKVRRSEALFQYHATCRHRRAV